MHLAQLGSSREHLSCIVLDGMTIWGSDAYLLLATSTTGRGGFGLVAHAPAVLADRIQSEAGGFGKTGFKATALTWGSKVAFASNYLQALLPADEPTRGSSWHVKDRRESTLLVLRLIPSQCYVISKLPTSYSISSVLIHIQSFKHTWVLLIFPV